MVDKKIRKEQADFWKSKGTTDQAPKLHKETMRQMTSQVPLYLNSIDLKKKAFDNMHRETLWKIMETYWIKSINLFIPLGRVSVIQRRFFRVFEMQGCFY